MYSIKFGQRFFISGSEYVFSVVYCKNNKLGVILIDINTGDRWTEIVEIDNNDDRTKPCKLTENQIKELFGSMADKFKNNLL